MAVRLAVATATACLLAGCPTPVAPTSSTPAPAESAPPKPPPASRSARPDNNEPCPHVEGEDAIRLEHAAFGPAAMSFGLVGQAWWQWDSEGHVFGRGNGRVWVVVHDGLSDDALATRFPVRQEHRCDHRYVTLPDARAYLRTHIDELDDPELADLAPTRAGLEDTLRALDAHFD